MLNATIPCLRILVAEDNALIGMLLADMLATMGHEVYDLEMTVAGTIASAARHRPDLMILDGRLRDGSGIDAADTISFSQIIPHIFVTGDPAHIHERLPDAVILRKPFDEIALATAIRQVLK
jgi:CheY-like chemotaxis protein